MKKRTLTLLVLVIALSLLTLAPATARHKPLAGPVDVEFNLGIEAGPYAGISYAGTAELDDVLYGIVFYPTGFNDWRHFRFFSEDWEIYPYDPNDPFFAFTEGVLTKFSPPGEPLMSGSDRGVTNMDTGRYWAVGRVTDAADPFEGRDGHRTFAKGMIEFYDFGAPHYARGTQRIR